MKTLLIFLLCILVPAITQAQTITRTVRGRVTDADTRSAETVVSIGILPLISYKVEF